MFLSYNETNVFKKIIVSLMIFTFLAILITELYKVYYLNKASSQPTLSVEGVVTNIFGPSSYTSFSINDVTFRSESMSGPCLDVREEIETNREVRISYTIVKDWPYTNRDFGCILEIDYISERNRKYNGQASRNNQE